jgi:hypothetical protein
MKRSPPVEVPEGVDPEVWKAALAAAKAGEEQLEGLRFSTDYPRICGKIVGKNK